MNRFHYVDISRGIVIILMVLGHSSIPHWLSNWIWSFHMPFFFFISGMMTSWKRENAFFFITKTRSLMLPFIVYSIVNLILIGGSGEKSSSIGAYMVYVAQNGWGGIPLWFVPILWIALLISKAIINSKRRWVISACLICLMAVGWILCFKHIKLPWTLTTIPIAVVYIVLGSYFHTRILFFQNAQMKKCICWVISGLFITLFISHYYRLDLADNSIIPFIPLFIASFAGIIMIIGLSVILSRMKFFFVYFLKNVGKYTYEIMALSYCLIFFLNSYIKDYVILKYIVMMIIIYTVVVAKRNLVFLLNRN